MWKIVSQGPWIKKKSIEFFEIGLIALKPEEETFRVVTDVGVSTGFSGSSLAIVVRRRRWLKTNTCVMKEKRRAQGLKLKEGFRTKQLIANYKNIVEYRFSAKTKNYGILFFRKILRS